MGTLVFQANLGGAVNLVGPNTASTVNFTLPSADGSSGQALVTNGSGTLSFSSFVSAAAGSNTQVQFNSSGAFAGSANLTFNGTTLTAANTSVTTSETLSYGTANGVAYLNGSKVVTTGSALTFDGTVLNASAGTPIIKATASTVGALYGLEFNGGALDAFVKAQPNNSELRIASGRSAGWGGFTSFYIDTAEQMRLTSTGLGIGTSSPGAKLDVSGFARTTLGAVFQGASNLATGAGLEIGYNASSQGYIQAFNRTASTYQPVKIIGSQILFDLSNTVSMTLDSSGNLGLGVTPSAWSAGKAYETTAAGHALWALSNEISVTQNAYFNAGWKYGATAAAARYQQQSGEHKWHIAASGTAGNAITFTQAMTLDASGRLGIGTTDTAGFGRKLIVNGTGGFNNDSGTVGIGFSKGTSLTYGYIGTGDWAVNGLSAADFGISSGSTGALVFGTAATERARITSGGRLNIGTTGGSASRLEIQGDETMCAFINTSATDATYRTTMSFTDSGGIQRGTIKVNNSATQYNTSSDYRLKENIQPMTGALAKVASLKPCTFNWKIDGVAGEGFIAHELAEVVPDAVAGEKDSVDAEGKPVYQGIDTSFLVATLTAAIQEQQALIQTLTERITALESK